MIYSKTVRVVAPGETTETDYEITSCGNSAYERDQDQRWELASLFEQGFKLRNKSGPWLNDQGYPVD